MSKTLVILGSTGSIGTQALLVVDDLKGIKDITVKAISGNKNVSLLEEQARIHDTRIINNVDINETIDIMVNDILDKFGGIDDVEQES